jgi:hypothetical protein
VARAHAAASAGLRRIAVGRRTDAAASPSNVQIDLDRCELCRPDGRDPDEQDQPSVVEIVLRHRRPIAADEERLRCSGADELTVTPAASVSACSRTRIHNATSFCSIRRDGAYPCRPTTSTGQLRRSRVRRSGSDFGLRVTPPRSRARDHRLRRQTPPPPGRRLARGRDRRRLVFSRRGR